MSPDRRDWHIPGQPVGAPPKGGRPHKGSRVEMKTRVAPEVAEALDRRAAEAGQDRSTFLAHLIAGQVN